MKWIYGALGIAILILVLLTTLVASKDRGPLAGDPAVRGGQDEPELSSSGTPDTAPLGAGARKLRVCDLASGEGVGQLPLSLEFPSGTIKAESDHDGWVLLPGGTDRLLAVVTPSARWKLCEALPLPLSQEAASTVWAYRTVALRGSVTQASPASTDSGEVGELDVEVLLVGLPGSNSRKRSPFPWSRKGRSLLRGVVPATTKTNANGTFELTVPACQGLVVRCAAEGWCPTWADVPVAGLDQHVVYASLQLRRRPVVSGRILMDRDSDLAAAGSAVRANLLLQYPRDAFDVNRARLYGVSFGSSVSKGVASMQLVLSVDVEQDGSFSVSLPVADADFLLTLHAPGYEPSRTLLRGVGVAVEGVEVAPKSNRSEPAISMVANGVPMGNAQVALTDITDNPFQTLVEFRLDGRGAVPHNWLEQGRSYWLVVGRAVDSTGKGGSPKAERFDGFLVYDGATAIELTTLSQDADALR